MGLFASLFRSNPDKLPWPKTRVFRNPHAIPLYPIPFEQLMFKTVEEAEFRSVALRLLAVDKDVVAPMYDIDHGMVIAEATGLLARAIRDPQPRFTLEYCGADIKEVDCLFHGTLDLVDVAPPMHLLEALNYGYNVVAGLRLCPKVVVPNTFWHAARQEVPSYDAHPIYDEFLTDERGELSILVVPTPRYAGICAIREGTPYQNVLIANAGSPGPRCGMFIYADRMVRIPIKRKP